MPLPGGEFAPKDFEAQLRRFRGYAPHLSERSSWRLMRNYGLRAYEIATADAQGMGQMFGDTLSAREVDYLIDNEWARTAEDILWRRSRLGLFVNDADRAALQTYVEGRLPAVVSSVSNPDPVARQNVA